MVISKAEKNTNFKGAIKGEVTCVAIMVLPEGKISNRGNAAKLYISDEKGIPTNTRTPKQIIILINLDLSSNK